MNRNKYVIFAFSIALISLSSGRYCFTSKIENENKMFIEVENEKERKIKKLESKLVGYAYATYKNSKKELKKKFSKEKKRKCKKILKKTGEFKEIHSKIHEAKINFTENVEKIKENLVTELNELEYKDSETFKKESKKIFKKYKAEIKKLVKKLIIQYKEYLLNLEKEAKKYKNID